MDNTFGERLRELRKRRRMNRDELGDILGVSGNAITAYETGKRNPRRPSPTNNVGKCTIILNY